MAKPSHVVADPITPRMPTRPFAEFFGKLHAITSFKTAQLTTGLRILMRPFTNQHSVHLALAFLFGAMDRQAPQQESDDVFVCVVMYQ
jgi:hypothetical protein